MQLYYMGAVYQDRDKMTDQKLLVDRILAGDQSAFKTLINQYQRLVTHFVFRMIPSAADREDICQEVFMKAYQHLERFRFDSSLSTWIGRIAYNTCLNFLEKKKLPLYDDLSDEDKTYEPAGRGEGDPRRRGKRRRPRGLGSPRAPRM